MTLEARIRALQASPLFENVPVADLAALAETMHEEYFGQDQLVCRQGEPADRVFMVVSGSLEVQVGGAPAGRLLHGELFGEFGLFAEGLRTASVVSLDRSVLLTLDYRRFRAFLIMFPETTLAILEATVRRLLDVQQKTARNRPQDDLTH